MILLNNEKMIKFTIFFVKYIQYMLFLLKLNPKSKEMNEIPFCHADFSFFTR